MALLGVAYKTRIRICSIIILSNLAFPQPLLRHAEFDSPLRPMGCALGRLRQLAAQEGIGEPNSSATQSLDFCRFLS